jgi:hypothetical protein
VNDVANSTSADDNTSIDTSDTPEDTPGAPVTADVDGLVDTDALAEGFEPSPVPDGYARLSDEAEAAIKRDGLTQFYGLRRMWSGWLIAWVSVLICFQIVLTFAIGFGLLDYREYGWFLPLVTAQNFLQIVGMAIVVVRFLHSGAKQSTGIDSY